MDRYQTFSNWLKAKGLKASPTAYPKYMMAIEKLLLLEITAIKSSNRLEVLLKELEGKKGFLSLPENERMNLKSGFKAYIDFVKELKPQPSA